MSGEPPALVVAIEVGEPELADRLAVGGVAVGGVAQ